MRSRFKLVVIILMTLVVIVVVDLGLTLYVNDGRLTFLQYVRSPDKDDSRRREMLIEENLKIVAEGDSIDLDKIEVWRDKFLVVYQIGISPIHYTSENVSKSIVNVRPIKSADKWLVSFNNNKTLYGFYPGQSCVSGKGDTTTFKFYHNSSGGIKPIGQIKIIPVDK